MLPVEQNFLDTLFNDSFFKGARTPGLSYDIIERDKDYLVKMDIPGLKKEDIKIELSDNVLSVKAERKEEKEEKVKNFIRKEVFYGQFEKHFQIPENIDSEKLEAKYENGVLKLILIKKAIPASGKKQILIK